MAAREPDAALCALIVETSAATSAAPVPSRNRRREILFFLLMTRSPPAGAHYTATALLRSPLVLLPGGAQQTFHPVVPFVAGVLINRPFGLRHGNLAGPGFSECRGVFNPEFVEQHVGADAREALHHMQILVRSPDVNLVIEVRGVHHQRVALPMAP